MQNNGKFKDGAGAILGAPVHVYFGSTRPRLLVRDMAENDTNRTIISAAGARLDWKKA
jgi:hypothetical protein